MKLIVRLFVAIGFVIVAHNLPAPIQEVQETPTPTPTAAIATPTVPKLQPNPAATPVLVPAANGAARYAGTWTGKINMQKLGDVDVTLVISTDGTSVQQGSRMGKAQRPSTSNGKIISWKTGAQNNIPWTFTPNSDGQTAVVTRTLAGTTTTANFKRVAAESGGNVTPSGTGRKGKRP